jgi:peptidoglycan/xylan/chitin deacetylase (PgdA/CDA1 family)
MMASGDPRWRSFPSYLDVAVPRILATLGDHRLAATVFVVGKDAAMPAHRAVLRAITDAGHEIVNHSFLHEPWLHLHRPAHLRAELALAEEHIERATGHVPVGFRGPAFSLSSRTVEVIDSAVRDRTREATL